MAARSGSKTAARAGRLLTAVRAPFHELRATCPSGVLVSDHQRLGDRASRRSPPRPQPWITDARPDVSDLADQPDDPKVTIALSVASMSITRRIQSTGDALGQAELLGKVSPPVPLDKGSHAPNVGYAYPRERGCARRFGFHWSRIGRPQRRQGTRRTGPVGTRKRSSNVVAASACMAAIPSVQPDWRSPSRRLDASRRG